MPRLYLYWCYQHGEWTADAVIEGVDSTKLCPVCKLPCAAVEIFNEEALKSYNCSNPDCKWFGWDAVPEAIITDGIPTGWTLTCPYCGHLVKPDGDDN